MTLLTVQDVTVRYGDVLALNRISLPALAAGEIMGVIGANASGKSTLLRTLADGRSHEGSIHFAGRSLRDIAAGERRRALAYLPQALPQPSALYVYELVMAHGRATSPGLSVRDLQRRVADVFERLELTPLAMKPLRELSGGKRQLVGVALTLVRQPQLLLLDEPTSALDLRWQFMLMEQVHAFVHAHRAGCLVALHDVNIASRYCDSLILLNDGHIVASGTPRAVITRENLAKAYGVEADIRAVENGGIAVAIHGPVLKRDKHAESDEQL